MCTPKICVCENSNCNLFNQKSKIEYQNQNQNQNRYRIVSQSIEYATVGYMAKRIQMRKQRFMAIQKIAEQKKQQLDGANQQQANPNPNANVGVGGVGVGPGGVGPGGPGGGGGGGGVNVGVGVGMGMGPEHGHGHGHHAHSHGHPHAPKQTVSNRPIGFSNIQQNVGTRGCSIVGPLFQEVRFKVHDPKAHSKGGTLENTVNGGRGGPQSHGPGPGQGGGPPGGGGGGGGGGGPPEGGGDPEAAVPAHLLHPGKVKKVKVKIVHDAAILKWFIKSRIHN